MKAKADKRETPLGDGLYLDNRSNSYLWRGRVKGKPATKRIRHPNGIVATPDNMTKTDARRIAKDIGADAANGTGRFFADTRNDGVTVEEAWAFYWQREASSLRSSGEKEAHWTNHIKPEWGNRPLASITKRDCSILVETRLKAALAAGETGTAANNLQKTLKRFFAWCLDEGYGATGLEASPMDGLKRKPVDVKLTKRPARALEEGELRWLFRAFERYVETLGHKQKRETKRRAAEALEFLLRSLLRREDILAAKWGWLQADGLLIPRTKTGLPILLTLTPSMRALMGPRPERARDGDRIWGRTMSALAHEIEPVRNFMTEIARSEGFNGDFSIPKFDGQHNPHYWALHDFRDCGKTVLARQIRQEDDMPMFPREVQEAALNHREGGVGAIYNADVASPYWMLPQRKRAGAFWNAFLDRVKEEALALPLAA